MTGSLFELLIIESVFMSMHESLVLCLFGVVYFPQMCLSAGFFVFRPTQSKNDAGPSAKSGGKKVKILFVIDVSVIILKFQFFLIIKSILKSLRHLTSHLQKYSRIAHVTKFVLGEMGESSLLHSLLSSLS